ncbi:MAG: GTP-binding protein [Eubacteriaceae bacterium]
MKRSKLMVIGGFLGAGKTTSMVEISEVLTRIGKKVALITNDQTDDLVDTHYIETQNIPVQEVTGSCFCCNFPGFKEKVEALKNEGTDFILAEPVGSCTDLVATIMKPAKMGKAGDVDVLPLSVVVEPRRLMDYMNQDESIFSKDVYYLFSKQLEEADFIILNKMDTLNRQGQEELRKFLETTYPDSRVFEISAREGMGIESWLLAVLTEDPLACSTKVLEVAYDTYASAEAEMGWLNAKININSEKEINGNDILFDLGKKLKDCITLEGGEIAHLKLFLESGHQYAKLNCVGVHQPIDIESGFSNGIKSGELTINIRASLSPEFLREKTLECMDRMKMGHGFSLDKIELDAFRPGYPTPTYRYQ